MDKLKMMSMDRTSENIEKIRAIFPNCVTEVLRDGKEEYAIDFDMLRQELSKDIVEGREERYQMTWPDKKKAIWLANSQINKTLRPCRKESVDFDNTENLYIEGDNLEVLKLLQETYLGKVKMIYIDPPYNTGNNIIYKNDFSMTQQEYNMINNYIDIDGKRLVVNSESNGRFHTDWLNMIFPVLKIARDIMSDDGCIFMAIDDHEVYNLKKIADEIFGEMNYVGTIITRCNPQGRNKKNIDPVHEYHLVYAKNYTSLPLLRIKKDNNAKDYGYLMRSGTNSRKEERPFRFYPILYKDGKVCMIEKSEYEKIYNPQTGFDEAFINQLKEKYEQLGYKYILPISKDGEYKVWQRVFDRVKEECDSYIYSGGQIKVPSEEDRTPVSLWTDEKYSNVAYGTNQLKVLFGDNKIPFDFSKSLYTVKDIVSLNTKENDIILDFFPGSATTAHAVLQLNAEDGGNRKFIMVQLPEVCDEKSEAYKAGYKNICEIGKERIRRAGKKIKEENPLATANLDTGFRVLKLDSSNMRDVFYKPEELTQMSMLDTQDNIKPDRSAEDLLFQVMLDMGAPLSAKIEQNTVCGKQVFTVADNYLMACFEDSLAEDVISAIAKQQPLYAVFRDSSFATDSVAKNVEQIFATYSPDTKLSIL